MLILKVIFVYFLIKIFFLVFQHFDVFFPNFDKVFEITQKSAKSYSLLAQFFSELFNNEPISI
jgi:dolichyl-phosphate-mannose--protein O-mannosyl transferase